MSKDQDRTVSEPTYASPEAVDEALSQMPPEYLECRGRRRHADPLPHTVTPLGDGIYEFWERCPRCNTLDGRVENLFTGEILQRFSRDYSTAEGYLIKGLGRIAGAAHDRQRLAARRIQYPQLFKKDGTPKMNGRVKIEAEFSDG